MNTEALITILNHPQQLKPADLDTLTKVIEKYPYFQPVKAIQLKALKDQGSYLYNQKLKETAAYTTDREILFNFITSKTFVSKSPIAPEETQNLEILTTQTIETAIVDPIDQPPAENHFDTPQDVIEDTTINMTSKEAQQITDPLLFEAKKNTISGAIKEKITLNLDEPLNFTQKETHSFTEWLRLAAINPIDRSENIHTKPKKKSLIESDLIENFLKNSPKINPVNKSAPVVNLAKQHIAPAEALTTETLAKVYLAQKNYKKAIQAYKILSLKNPEKSGLFADQIRAIEKLKDNKQ